MNNDRNFDHHLTRGTFFVGVAALGAAVVGEGAVARAANASAAMTPDAALHRLMDANAAFVRTGGPSRGQSVAERTALASGQHPFAAILTCADSRTAPEIFFHQGLGDIFVVRVAGNVATTTEVASLEYAAAVLKTPLVLVVGHTACGAVGAGIGLVEGKHFPGEIGKLAALIEPAAKHTKGEAGDWQQNAMKANVGMSVAALRRSSVLADLEKSGELKIAGAFYDLATGKVSAL